MADGRQHIEDARTIILEVAAKLDGLKDSISADEYAEFELYMTDAQKWVNMCRRKVWLRGKEGTDKAQRCLDTAQDLQASLDQPAVAVDAAGDLSAQLESLARILATKSQTLT